jgi:adenylate kinase
MMRLVLIGPPGSGKGTQAKLLSDRLQLAHIGTGDILREAVRLKTPEGILAEPYVKAGKLVPDDVVNELVAARFRRADRPDRFVMDGYPRTLPQAVAFDQVLRQHSLNLDAVLVLMVDDDEIVRRISGRWGCPNPNCKATYHTTTKPPRIPGICDLCGTALVQREDDREETVRRRLEVYRQNILSLHPYYRAQGILHEGPGVGEIESIYNSIVRIISPGDRPC